MSLEVRFRGLKEAVPASSLSDGQLAYLGFVALARLPTVHTLVAFDEPECHLHPDLLVRVTSLLQELARSRPVLVATHSNQLLDAIDDPARSVVLCELDERRAMKMLRPDPVALAKWLKIYNGMGALRAAGLARRVMADES